MPAWGLGLCVAVGIVAGLQSALMTICLYGVEDLFRKLPIHWMWWPAIGGLGVGIGGLFDPAALGVGYENIRALLHGGLDVHAAIELLLVKAGIWVVALSSGTSGGVLAPLLIMGGALGSIEGHYLPLAEPGFWALVGMAAILGGTMRVPLTGTLFAVEISGNSHILLPLLAASVAAFAVTVLLMRRSILTERIARRGHHIWREYTIDPFLQTRVEEIMAKPVDTLARGDAGRRGDRLLHGAGGAGGTRAIRSSTQAVISSAWSRAPTSCAGPATAWTTASAGRLVRADECCRHARRPRRRSRRPHGGRGRRPRAGLGARQRQGRRPGRASRSVAGAGAGDPRRAGARPRAAAALGEPAGIVVAGFSPRSFAVFLRWLRFAVLSINAT